MIAVVFYDDLVTVTAVDLFAGAGGATEGLRQAGLDVLAAVENEHQAANSYRVNHPKVILKEQDIRKVDAVSLRRELGLRPGSLGVLKACPPCQGFSSLAKGEIDEDRNDLVLDITRFAIAFRPRVIILENVPGLRRDLRMSDFCEILSSHGYRFARYIVDAASFGVPQRRKRLIVIGVFRKIRHSLPDDLTDLLPEDFQRGVITVGEAFAALELCLCDDDPLNRPRRMADSVKARIEAIPINGTRFDLPDELALECHKKLRNSRERSATASYGRLRLDKPAPTMTTRCTTPACGSFVHPTENRGITLREAATLQTFPANYRFCGGYDSIERQIGNAVPVRMAKAIGLAAKKLYR
jgi:DNA (cytosine-5)-methyltransferase 1